jgi:hypothetical protein
MTTANTRWVGYGVAVVALWIFIPELRRLIDWGVGGGISSVLPLVPLAAMVPAALALRSWATGIAGIVAVAMVAALSYAGVVGFVSGNGAGPVIYTFGDFLLPMLFGGWLAQRASADPAGFARFTRIVLFMIAGSAAYGIVAYATLPPWEAQWLSAGTSTLSTGVAAPFGFRVYATMNSPGIFATFVALVLVLNLPNLLQRRAPDLIAAAVCSAALALSLVRSAWIALVVGLIVYLVLSPARAKLAGAFAIVALTIAIPATVLVAVAGNSDAVTSFTSRVGSFGDIGNDDSANDRTNQIAGALQMALDAPFGAGLGVFGAVTQLSTVNGEVDYIDSGYLARFVELGVFGTLAMALAVGLALACGVACAISARRERYGDAVLMCSFFAIQAGMVWLMFSGDLMRASNGMLFWIASFALIGAVDRAGAAARERRAPFAAVPAS